MIGDSVILVRVIARERVVVTDHSPRISKEKKQKEEKKREASM